MKSAYLKKNSKIYNQIKKQDIWYITVLIPMIRTARTNIETGTIVYSRYFVLVSASSKYVKTAWSFKVTNNIPTQQ